VSAGRQLTRSRKKAPCRPTLESLEDRVVPATLLHLYDLNGTLSDALGGPALVSDGGPLTATGDNYSANQGLRLTGGLASTTNYSMVMDVNIPGGSFFKNLIDFQNRQFDMGLYDAGTRLQLYPLGAGSGDVPFNTDVQIALTRDSATGITAVY